MTDEQAHPNADSSASAPATSAVILYQATVQHWCHAEQIRWTLLYNYLMASTILLLAWTTVFTSAGSTGVVRFVLVTLSVAGTVMSAVWIALGLRASEFVHTYATNGKKFETKILATQRENGAEAPFTAAETYRDSRGCMKRLSSWAKSRYVVSGVPAAFLLIYILLMCASFWK